MAQKSEITEQDLIQIRERLKSQKDWAQVANFDIKAMSHGSSDYTPEQKLEAVTVYLSTGSVKKTAQICRIPEGTITAWKSRTAWWDDCVYKLRQTLQDELEASLTGLINRSVLILEDRLDNGDWILDKGKRVRRPITAKEASSILAVLYDKRAHLRGDPTSRVEHKSEEATMNRLLQRMEDTANKMKGNIINIVPESVQITKDIVNSSE